MIKKKILFPLVIVLLSILVNYVFLNHSHFPTLTGDSQTYINFSDEIKSGILPNTMHRTPSYPLLIYALTSIGDIKLVVYFQIIIGAISMVIFYLILDKLTHLSIFSFIATIFSMFDFGLIWFQSTILTESTAIFLVISFIYFHLETKLGAWSIKKLLIILFIDIALIFIRPTFVVFPITIYLLEFGLARYHRLNSRSYIPPITGILVNLLFLLSYLFLNCFRYGYFQLSDVSDINTLDKIVQYKLIEEPLANDAPVEIRAIQTIYFSNNTCRDARCLLQILGQKFQYQPSDEQQSYLYKFNVTTGKTFTIKDINKYYIDHFFTQYVVNTIAQIPTTLTSPEISSVLPDKLFQKNLVFIAVAKIYQLSNILNPIALFYCVVVAISQFIKKANHEKFLLIIVCILIVNTVITSALTFGEERMRAPVELLFRLSIFYSIYHVCRKTMFPSHFCNFLSLLRSRHPEQFFHQKDK